MKPNYVVSLTIFFGLLAAARPGFAQANLGPASPSILGITQEAVVPGKMTTVVKNHAIAAATLRAINHSRIALGMISVSGPEEVWTFNFYNALADIESDRQAVEESPATKTAIDRLDESESGSLTRRNVQTATFLKDLSYQPEFDWSQARFLDVIVVHVRPGHHPEYLELRRMSLAGHLKGELDGPLHVFKVNTGVTGLAWMIVRPLRSLRQHDELRAKGFGEILTPQEDAKMVELRAVSMESAEERFFRIDPQISRVPETWSRRNPEFWAAASQ